ncbi:MAG: hypothetical protein ACOY3O_00360 [Thermodesulfobacteriota bacterium]
MNRATSIDQKDCTPVAGTMTKVIIHVEGGLVQAVYSAEELDIQVYDLDVPDFATEAEYQESKTIAADFARQIRNLQQIY